MGALVQVSVPVGAGLAELEQACRTARDQGMPDDAKVNFNIFGPTVTISAPSESLTRPAGEAPEQVPGQLLLTDGGTVEG